MNTSFFGEMLNSITERGRALLDRTRDRRTDAASRSETLAELCEELLTGRGEASGVALAEEILAKYAELKTGPRIAFFEALASRFGPDRVRLDAAIAAWQAAPSDTTAAEIHAAAEARRQELLRRLNLAPRGTAVLVRGNRTLTLRSVFCDASERDDELHRVLLFYRERAGVGKESETALDRLLVVGEQLDKARVTQIAEDTFGVRLKPLAAGDVGLMIPPGDLDFDAIAAPAGLARLAW
jgi:hypothetical protein